MKANPSFAHTIQILGYIAFIVGVLDPMEGSVVIAAGSVLIALGMWLGHAEPRKMKLWAIIAAVIVIDVAWLFAISSVGGFGGRTGRSMWWGLTLLPYPVAWLVGLISIIRELKDHWTHRHHPATT